MLLKVHLNNGSEKDLIKNYMSQNEKKKNDLLESVYIIRIFVVKYCNEKRTRLQLDLKFE